MLEIRRGLQWRLGRSCHRLRLAISMVGERCQKMRTKKTDTLLSQLPCSIFPITR